MSAIWELLDHTSCTINTNTNTNTNTNDGTAKTGGSDGQTKYMSA